jgi:hypothetical protein
MLANYALGLEVGLLGWCAYGLFQTEHEVDPAYWFAAMAVIIYRLHKSAAQSPEAKAAGTKTEPVPAVPAIGAGRFRAALRP